MTLLASELDKGYFRNDLDPDWIDDALRAGRKGRRGLDFQLVMTGIRLRDTMHGSSELQVTYYDPTWDMVDSGLLDANDNGRLDPRHLNYPNGSKQWWTLSQVGVTDAPGGGASIDLRWIERPAWILLNRKGPKKSSRAQMTRAEFLSFLTADMKPPIIFTSAQLKKRQPIKKKSKDESRADKDPGIADDENLTVNGNEMSSNQRAEATTLLATAEDEKAGPKATLALICAAIGESTLGDHPNTYTGNELGFWGVLQGSSGKNPKWPAYWPDPHDTAGQARSFLRGGKGFQGGGAIALAKAHPSWTAGQIATTVEGSGEEADYYDAFRTEARAIIEAYGGDAAGTLDTYTEQYNFEVGSQDQPHETYWDAMQRLASEVRWALFLDQDRLYYDAETTLIRQKPVAIIRRDAPEVLRCTFNWDVRHIATEATVDVMMWPFWLRAGEVVKLEGYGPASTGSRVGLPGRWLIEEIEHDFYAGYAMLQLKQPQKQAPEPRSQEVERSGDRVEQTGSLENMTAKQVINDLVLPLAEQNDMTYGITAADVETANARHSYYTSSGNISDHTGLGGIRWAADMGIAGISYPEKKKKQLAQDIADLFGIPWKGYGAARHTTRGFHMQLIYDDNPANGGGRGAVGDHDDHVHFGLRKEGPYSDQPPGPQPSVPAQRP